MPIDTKRMNQKREQVKKGGRGSGGDFHTFEEGDTKCFLHPLSYPDDDHELTGGFNFIEMVMHYGVGGKRGGVLCLDQIANPIITHPLVVGFLAKRKKPIKLKKGTTCPVCDAIRDGELSAEQAGRQSGQGKWLFGLTPVAYRRSKEDEWSKRRFETRTHIAGVTIFNGLSGAMIDAAPDDITDPEAASLVIVNRTGTKYDNTEYEVKDDRETSKKPLKLDKGQRRIITEAVKPGGACDLFKVVANLVKTPVEIQAQMAGVRVDEDEPTGGEDDERKSCFGLDWEDSDDECKGCADEKECKAACEGGGSDASGEGDEGDGDGEDGGDETRDTDAEERDRSGATSEEQEVDADGDPVDADSDDDPGDDGNPDCWGEHEDGHPDCKVCVVNETCIEETKARNETDSEPEPEPEPEPESEPEPEATEAEEDPDLEAIEAEAQRLASKNRRKPAAARGKKAGGKKAGGKKTGGKK